MKCFLFCCLILFATSCFAGEGLTPIQKNQPVVQQPQVQYIAPQVQYIVPQYYVQPSVIVVQPRAVVVQPKTIAVPGGVFVHERAGLFGWHRKWNLYPSIYTR